MPVIGVAEVLVKPSFKGTQQSVAREMDGIAEESGKSAGARMGAALGGALKVGAVAVGGAAIAGLGVALTKGFGRLQAIENAKAKLTGLGHDVETVTGIMNDAMAAVKGTAFGLDEAATVAAGAVAAGVKPGKDLERTLRLTGDAATIAGAGMGEMGAIFNKVASSNKIQGDVIAQLNDAGIPIVQLMGKELGKTAEETLKLASEGAINFETFQKAMENGLGGAALKSGDTLEGAFKNTMAAVGRIGANLLSGVYPKIREFFSNAIEWLKPLEEGAKVAGEAIGTFLEKALTGFQGISDILFKGDFTGKMTEAFGVEEDHPFVDFLFRVRESVINLSNFITTDLIPAVQGFGDWVVKNKDWLSALAITVGTMVVGMKLWTGAIATWRSITSVATAIQLGFNAALAANPIGLIVVGIAALVAGLVWFFTQTELGQDIVKNVWGFIQSAIGAVVDWFTGTAVPAWDGAVKAVGGFFNWLWTDVIKPVFDGIGAVIGWVYNSVIKPVFDGISAAVKFVATVFTWWYTTILKPMFDSAAVIINGFLIFFQGVGQLIASVFTYVLVPIFMTFWNAAVETFTQVGATIGSWWDFAVGIFNTAVAFIRDVLAAAFTWLHQSVVKPVFDGIAAAATWLWNSVLKPTFDSWVWVFTKVIPDALNWLYVNAIKPVFDAIGSAVNWVWMTLLKPVFDAWVWFFMTVIPNAVNWLYSNAIKPAFDNIGSAIKTVWDTVVKPVFDFLTKAINEEIPKAFETGVAAVKKIWEGIQEIAKAPVRFVVNTVINDGLIGAFNTVAGALPGITKLDKVGLPAGFADGGYTGDGGKYQPAGIVHAGEFVFTKEQTKRAGVRNLYAMAEALAGYAKGGLVRPIGSATVSQPFHAGHNGIDFAAPTGSPVVAAGPGRVSSAGWSSYGGGNEIHIDHPNGLQTWYAHLSSFAAKMGQMVTAGTKIGEVGSTGNSTGPHLHYMVLDGGWPNYKNPAEYLDGGGESGSGGGWSFDPIAPIIDGLVSLFKLTFPAGGMMADIAIGVGRKALTSASDFLTGKAGKRPEDGKDSMGSTGLPYLHDNGGILNPGLSQIMNATRKPEYILNDRQWDTAFRAMQQAQGPGRGDIIFQGNVGWDPDEVAHRIETKRSDTFAAFGF